MDGIIDDMLSQVPQPFNHEKLMRDKAHDPSPLHITLFQEVEQYNILIETVLRTLKLLKKGIKGLVVMSADLDAIFDALASNKVPALYLKSYPSLKPLRELDEDLMARLEQIGDWIENTYPSATGSRGSRTRAASSPPSCRRRREKTPSPSTRSPSTTR